MTEASVYDLNFGHFGTAVYGPDTREWEFSRIGERQPLRELGVWRIAIPSPIQFPTPSLGRPLQAVQQSAKRLVRDCPHLTPAVEQLSKLEIVSAALISATTTHDATVGDLLSFGSITCEGHPTHQARQVVALPTGETGNVLRLQTLERVRRGWGTDNDTYLEDFSMADGESGFWSDEVAPIQQICFPQSGERSLFLAVRFPRRTVIFRPTYLHSRNPTAQASHRDSRPTAIDARLIHSIPIEDTNSTPHAHLAFNPDYQRQFGLVDQQGNWFIWDIDDGHRTSQYSITLAFVGSIATTLEDPTTLSTGDTIGGKEDGWARIMWVGDANTILVCNRRQLGICNLKGGSTALKCPRLVAESSADWILDVQRHPKNGTQFFVVTSTQLLLLAVTCPSDDSNLASVKSGAAVLLSWTHFRGIEDITLQLYVHVTSTDDCLVLVYSRLNTLVTIYRLKDRASTTRLALSSSDPIVVNVAGFDAETEPQRITQLRLERLSFREHKNAKHSGQGQTYLENNVEFYQLSIVSTDLRVRQVLLYSFAGDGDHNLTLAIDPTSWAKLTKSRHPQHFLVDSDLDNDDFVEPDELIHALIHHHTSPVAIKRQGMLPQRNIIDFRSLYNALIGSFILPDVNRIAQTEAIRIEAVTEEAEKLLIGNHVSTEFPLGTLLEYAGMPLVVSDIDEASSKLRELFFTRDSPSQSALRSIADSQGLGFPRDELQEPILLSSLYDSILQNWITPLLSDIPVRARQVKERLARRLAAEAQLSRMRFRRNDARQISTASQTTTGQHSVFAPPNVESEPHSTAGPSQTPIDSHRDIFPDSSQVDVVKDPLSRLSNHLRIENPRSAPIPSSINKVLTHWHFATDPSTYDWKTTERALHEDLGLDEEETQQQRERSRRKKERQEKRQRKENELFRGTMVSQPQVLRSSPGPMFGANSSQLPIQSQSQSQSQNLTFMIQSQQEPGKHGGRPALKKKAKNRMSGF